MADIQSELEKLREIIANEIYIQEIWDTLNAVCKSLGLADSENPNGLGKEKYLHKVTAESSDQSIISAARKILVSYPGSRGQPSASTLQKIQDSIWWIDNQGIQKISNVTRFSIIEWLEGKQFWGRFSISELLRQVLPIAFEYGIPNIGEDGKLYQTSDALLFMSIFAGSKQIPDKLSRITVLEYFQQIGLSDWPDERFCLLIERILHPEIQTLKNQQKLLEHIQTLLEQDSFTIVQDDFQGGFPTYKVQRKESGVSGSPKYIIFGSSGLKPDIVIDDAVSMDIRVVRYADQCLIYDQPPPQGDLTWQMLLDWWGQQNNINPKDPNVRREFGLRLRASLQSEAEQLLFDTYFKEFRKKFGANLPALLPQVYLHYDPRHKNERGKPVLVRQRMDFLLLLRNSVRIVLEIDGIQHYGDEEGLALPRRYAEMVSEDRRIRLLGYEIYRFGGAEFVTLRKAKTMITKFFTDLFLRYEIKPESNREAPNPQLT